MSLQFVCCLCHFIPAIALLTYVGAKSEYVDSDVDIYFDEFWPLCGNNTCDDGCYRLTKSVPSFKLSLGVLVPFFSIVSGTNHLIQGFSILNANKMTMRWIVGGTLYIRYADYAISASLMLIVLNALFVSPTNVQINVLSVSMMGLVILCGYASEAFSMSKENERARVVFGITSALFAMGFGSGFVLFIIGRFNASPETAHPPSIAYFSIAWLFVSFAPYPVIHGCKIGWSGNTMHTEGRTLKYETLYSLASFLKIPLLGVFFIAVTAQDGLSDFTPGDVCSPAELATTTYAVVGSFIVACLLICGVYIYKMWTFLRTNKYTHTDIPFKKTTRKIRTTVKTSKL